MKHIIFDMDGVLVNTEPEHYAVWVEVLAEYGLEHWEYEKYKPCIGSTLRTALELVYYVYGLDVREDPSVLPKFREKNEERIRRLGLPPVEGAVETVKALHAAGYCMAVASSSPQSLIELCMKKLGLSDCFSVLFSGERAAHPKPFPDTFLEAAKALGAAPCDCVVVEDSKNGTRAAKAAGMYCVGFYNPDSGNQDLSAADEIITDIRALLELPILKGE